ncbi:hypothetical protein KJ780_04680 [Candidatus Micrarchaeota archaeon]|nr:hypothetical protein [Candidatus Micrarchaeota archaeon]
MKGKLIVIAFILLAQLSFSCSPQYEETATIQILDSMGRHIENASVEITYQVDFTTGKGYTTTAPKITPANGTVTFIFRNQEKDPNRVNCKYKVNVTYDNIVKTQEVNVDNHSNTISVILDAYQLKLKAIDQNGNVLVCARFTVRNLNKITDSGGNTAFILGKGPINLSMRYGNGQVSRNLNITGDMDYIYEAGVYELNLFVLNDDDKPIDCKVYIGEEWYNTGSGGSVSVEKLLNAQPLILIVYKNLEKRVESVNLALRSNEYIIFDLHAPTISELEASVENKEVVLRMDVEDPGLRASGLAGNGLQLRYSFNGNSYDVLPNLESGNTYVADLKAVNQSGLVEFTVDATDHEGNKRILKGYFSVNEETEEDANGSNGNEEKEQGLDIVLVVGGVVIIIVIIAVVYYIRKKFIGE